MIKVMMMGSVLLTPGKGKVDLSKGMLQGLGMDLAYLLIGREDFLQINKAPEFQHLI